MKCDVCNQEFANSQEVERHKEEVHPMGDGEKPDFMENPAVSDAMPEPAERRTS
jgi:hypothetical protein